MKGSIHYFQRKRREGMNFSLEQIFDDLRIRLTKEYSVQKIVAPFISKGVLPRLINTFYALFNQGDINHITGDINYVNIFLKKKKTVLTILDCGVLHRVSGLKYLILKLIWFKIPAQRSKNITVISQATKEDLLKQINCNPNKIKVIYVPISEEFVYVPKEFNKEKPRILQIGSAPNKNLSRLIESCEGICCKIVIIGEISYENSMLLKKYHIEYENHVGLPFIRVIEEYSKCDLLFFASTFEGFGMPILEAQSTGRPVITSNILSMPEVGGSAAHYVNPYSVDEIRDGILRIVEDTTYRNNLIKKGLKNVKRFDPEVIANQYKALYDKILN